MENENLGLQTMLDDAQMQLEREFASSSSLKDHAKTIIGVSSVVVSFFATFKVFDNVVSQSNTPLIILLILIGLVYGALMIFAIKAASPFALHAPIEPNIENYTTAFAYKDERIILSHQINAYLKAILKNKDVIEKQSKLTNLINILLGVVVVLIISATVFSILMK
ncbi:MAG TPA: hypothetical protein VLZ89_16445 [Anaerolineales bacterium]|nr:hypothetical protein [Anaerolineales bacterium]